MGAAGDALAVAVEVTDEGAPFETEAVALAEADADALAEADGEAGSGGEAVADGGKLAEAEGEGDGRATTLDTAGAAYVVPFGSTAGLEATAAARAGNEAAPAFVTALDAALLLAAGTAAATCTPMTSLPEDRKRPP